ncbi:MAG: hypothetical protein BWY82_01148 [Verrucomicrobia bacterium ADurb.Bin474]|nr:MAG: hypothetical protein BWY82_01148 [Verrucomicrobia bacterium ADurb.Bin474]
MGPFLATSRCPTSYKVRKSESDQDSMLCMCTFRRVIKSDPDGTHSPSRKTFGSDSPLMKSRLNSAIPESSRDRTGTLRPESR